MKKFILISFVAVLFAANAFAQDDKYGPNKAECLKYISYYEEYVKQKAYDEAVPAWRQAYRLCPPSSRQTILTNGTTLVRRLISKNAKNPEYRQALIDTLFTLHDQRAQFFPKYKVTALNNKGQDVFNYIKDDNAKLFNEYSAIINENKELTKPTLFVHQFNAATELYKGGKMDAETLINLYQQNNDYLSGSADEDAASARAELEARFIQSGVASCETLLALLTPKFEADPANAELAGRIVRMLNVAEDCIKNDLYLKAVTVMHADNPSYNSAFAALIAA